MEGLPFVLVFVDDLCIFSESADVHSEHVKEVVQRLTAARLTLNVKKCHFGYKRLRVLGHVLSGSTRAPDPKKLSTMGEYPVPTSGKQEFFRFHFLPQGLHTIVRHCRSASGEAQECEEQGLRQPLVAKLSGGF